MKLKRRYRLFLWILLVVIVNVVVSFYDYRTKPAERTVYELDEASLRVLQGIDEPIIITFYKSNNLNALEERFANAVVQILEAYKNVAQMPIHLEIINPYESLDVELEATNAGIKSMEIKGQNNNLRKIFLGIIVQAGNRTEVLTHITPRMSIEYLVSSSLRKLVEKRRRKIAVIQGHGEPYLHQISGVKKRLHPNYNLDSVVLSPETPLLDYASLFIVAPSFKYTDAELDQLDAFLNAGRNIFIALDRVEYDTEDEEGYKIDSRLEEWLVRKGLIVQSDFIVDNSCSDVRIEGFAPAVAFPYFPQVTNFPTHVATEGVGVIALRYASSIESANRIGVTFTALAKTSEVSGKRSLPLRINLKHEWTKGDYLFPRQVVAAIVEGKLGGQTDKESKIVVISDGDVVLGDDSLRGLDNHLFVANIIDWISDNTGLAALKQKGVTQEQREVQQVQISSLRKYTNLFLPLLLVVLLALFSCHRKKRNIDKLRTADF